MNLKNIKYLALLLLLLLFVSCSETRQSNINISDGKLDISLHNFKEDGTVKLNGEWKFYWKQLLSYDDLKDPINKSYKKFNIPGLWTDYRIDDYLLPSYGYSTFTLEVESDENLNKFALKIPEMFSSYKLFVNDELISKNGTVGKTEEEVTPYWKPLIGKINISDKKILIILQISNFDYKFGGLWKNIEFGYFDQIHNIKSKNLFYDIFLFGSILLMTLYHFVLYFLRKKDKYALYFGIICLIFASKVLLINEMYFLEIFPNISWELFLKLNFLGIAATVPAFVFYFNELLVKKTSKKFLYFSVISSSLYALSIIIFPAKIHSLILSPYYHIVLVITGVYLIYQQIVSARQKQKIALISLLAFLVIFIATINDILSVNNIINTGQLTPLGLFIFLFAQSVIISINFSRAFHKVENLSEELKGLNNYLKIKNKDLKDAYDELKSSHEYILKQEKLASLGTISAGITHEINNPAQAIKSSMQCFKLNIKDIEQLVKEIKNLSNLKKTDEKLAQLDLLNELLDYLDIDTALNELNSLSSENEKSITRIEKIIKSTKKLAYSQKEYIECSIQDVIEDAITLLSNQIKYFVTVNTHYENSIPKFYGSFQEISQVLINLIINARDSIIEKGLKVDTGKIDISVKYNKKLNKIIIYLKDNGNGIPDDVIKKIYDPFFTTKSMNKGTGLGLNIIHKIISSHNGNIEVVTKIGEETTFILELPCVANDNK